MYVFSCGGDGEMKKHENMKVSQFCVLWGVDVVSCGCKGVET